MSSFDLLRSTLLERFREHFGKPHAQAGGGAAWSLPPPGKLKLNVHLVVTGWNESPGVWVFDPHDPVHGLEHTQINDIAQIDPLIQSIRARVNPNHFESLRKQH